MTLFREQATSAPILVGIEFGVLVLVTRRKTLEARREPATNSTHISHRLASPEHGPCWWKTSVLAYSTNSSIYYPTALRRVQITPKTSTNITRYYSTNCNTIQIWS